MATSWMAAKTAKIKRDGIARSRGISPTFAKTERDHYDTTRLNMGKGFWVVALDKTPRGLPRSYGPFPDRESAEQFGRGMVTPPRKGQRPMADDYRVDERGVERPKPASVIPSDPTSLAAIRAEHAAKLAADLELRKAEREALGRKTDARRYAWSR